VFLAERIVKSGWPDAELYEVQCNLPKGVINPTSNPMDLSQLKAIWWVLNGTVLKWLGQLEQARVHRPAVVGGPDHSFPDYVGHCRRLQKDADGWVYGAVL
jgi:hypothetical protein